MFLEDKALPVQPLVVIPEPDPFKAWALRAADYMALHGYTSGALKRHDGRVCLYGALIETNQDDHRLIGLIRLLRMTWRLSQHILGRKTFVPVRLIVWNDMQEAAWPVVANLREFGNS